MTDNVPAKPRPTTEITIPSIESDYQNFFGKISKFDVGDMIYKSDCKFCKHPLRKDAEAHWEQKGRNFTLVKQFFDDVNKLHPDDLAYPPMNSMNIRGHLLNHYLQQEKNIWSKEYTDRILDIMNYKVAMDQKLDFVLQALEVQFVETGSDPTLFITKKNESMVKLAKTMTEVVQTQADLRGDIRPMNILMDKIKTVWIRLIDAQQDESVKRLLLDSLNTFRTELEGMPLLEDKK